MSAQDMFNVYDMARMLPDLVTLGQRCRALAILDTILSPEWESRYYTYDPAWAIGEQMASMRNGSGDEFSIVFAPARVFIRGFDHESPMSPFANDGELWPGLLEGIPESFAAQVSEPAFHDEGTLSATFCLWRETGDIGWNTGSIEFPPVAEYRHDPDGSGLLRILCDGTGSAYTAFAADYYEAELDQTAVAHVYAGLPLSDVLVQQLNPGLIFADIEQQIRDMGRPRHA